MFKMNVRKFTYRKAGGGEFVMNTDWALQVNKMLVRVSQTKMGFTVFNGSHKAASKWKQ